MHRRRATLLQNMGLIIFHKIGFPSATHSEEKSYTCEMSDTSFSTNSGVKVHMPGHTGEK